MTTVQKLQRLLVIANKHGYESNSTIIGFLIYEKKETNKLFRISDLLLCFENDRWNSVCSINDIILDFEQEGDSSSFVKALCKASNSCINICEIVKTHNYKQIRTAWATNPSSDRLDWLFNTFSHFF